MDWQGHRLPQTVAVKTLKGVCKGIRSSYRIPAIMVKGRRDYMSMTSLESQYTQL